MKMRQEVIIQTTIAALDEHIKGIVSEAVRQELSKYELRKDLPARLSIAGAARATGMSVNTFKKKFKHLIKSDGRVKYVRGDDLKSI